MNTAAPAHAATGQVVLFTVEFQELTTWDDPTGCYQLPIGAHQVNNHTDSDVHIYADPFCMQRVQTIKPGYGAHVMAATGSFSA
ncbi:MAG: hypothetical protein HOQ04_11940 [Pseudarthrobacter sp.]|nr:hypothetical protein [Pseudarthrobacter sp.]